MDTHLTESKSHTHASRSCKKLSITASRAFLVASAATLGVYGASLSTPNLAYADAAAISTQSAAEQPVHDEKHLANTDNTAEKSAEKEHPHTSTQPERDYAAATQEDSDRVADGEGTSAADKPEAAPSLRNTSTPAKPDEATKPQSREVANTDTSEEGIQLAYEEDKTLIKSATIKNMELSPEKKEEALQKASSLPDQNFSRYEKTKSQLFSSSFGRGWAPEKFLFTVTNEDGKLVKDMVLHAHFEDEKPTISAAKTRQALRFEFEAPQDIALGTYKVLIGLAYNANSAATKVNYLYQTLNLSVHNPARYVSFQDLSESGGDYHEYQIRALKESGRNYGVDLPDAPYKEGKTFIGWFTEPNMQGSLIGKRTPFSQTTTVYAGYTDDASKHVVSFDPDIYGYLTDTKDKLPYSGVYRLVNVGESLEAPELKSYREKNYGFIGWFEKGADSSAQPVDLSAPITKSMHLIARYNNQQSDELQDLEYILKYLWHDQGITKGVEFSVPNPQEFDRWTIAKDFDDEKVDFEVEASRPGSTDGLYKMIDIRPTGTPQHVGRYGFTVTFFKGDTEVGKRHIGFFVAPTLLTTFDLGNGKAGNITITGGNELVVDKSSKHMTTTTTPFVSKENWVSIFADYHPSKEGMRLVGWLDEKGTLWTDLTEYLPRFSETLTAQWEPLEAEGDKDKNPGDTGTNPEDADKTSGEAEDQGTPNGTEAPDYGLDKILDYEYEPIATKEGADHKGSAQQMNHLKRRGSLPATREDSSPFLLSASLGLIGTMIGLLGLSRRKKDRHQS